MAFRIAWQGLRRSQRPLVSQINKGRSQATEKCRHAYQIQNHVTSSSAIRHTEASPTSGRSIRQKLYPRESCRSFGTGSRSEVEERVQSPEAISSQTVTDCDDSPEITPSVSVAVESAYISSPRHDLAMLFTCTVCETRCAKTMSRASYETGVVIVRCPGCKNLHLIADRYGWFGEKGGVEEFLAEKGIDFRTGSDSSYEFSVEDLAGWSPRGKSEQV